MRDFFNGWQRKVGCIALLMACVSMTVWYRSQAFVDEIRLRIAPTAFLMTETSAVAVELSLVRKTYGSDEIRWPLRNGENWRWNTDAQSDDSETVTNDILSLQGKWSWGQSGGDHDSIRIPHLVSAATLTTLSAGLILWKPRKKRVSALRAALTLLLALSPSLCDRSAFAQSHVSGEPSRTRQLTETELQVIVAAASYVKERKGGASTRIHIDSIPLGATSLAMQRISQGGLPLEDGINRNVLRGLLRNADGKRISVGLKGQQMLDEKHIQLQSGGNVAKRDKDSIAVSLSVPFVGDAEQAAIVMSGNIGDYSTCLFCLRKDQKSDRWEVIQTVLLLIE